METDSKNKGLVRSCAENLLSNQKQKSYSKALQGNCEHLQQSTGVCHQVHPGDKDQVCNVNCQVLGCISGPEICSAVDPCCEARRVQTGGSWLPRCNLRPETVFSLIRCIYRIATEVYCYIITTRRNSDYTYHQKRRKAFKIVVILKAVKFSTVPCSQNKLLHLKRLTSTGALCSTTNRSF